MSKALLVIVFSLLSLNLWGSSCIKIQGIEFDSDTYDFVCADIYNLLIEKPYFYSLKTKGQVFLGMKNEGRKEKAFVCDLFGIMNTKARNISFHEQEERGVIINSTKDGIELAYGTNFVIKSMVCN